MPKFTFKFFFLINFFLTSKTTAFNLLWQENCVWQDVVNTHNGMKLDLEIKSDPDVDVYSKCNNKKMKGCTYEFIFLHRRVVELFTKYLH